jgi:hypothetical protein
MTSLRLARQGDQRNGSSDQPTILGQLTNLGLNVRGPLGGPTKLVGGLTLLRQSTNSNGTTVTRPPGEQRQSGLLNEVVLLARFTSTEISITGTEASGLVNEVGLLTELVFNRGYGS